jgi:hypothetical protein
LSYGAVKKRRFGHVQRSNCAKHRGVRQPAAAVPAAACCGVAWDAAAQAPPLARLKEMVLPAGAAPA